MAKFKYYFNFFAAALVLFAVIVGCNKLQQSSDSPKETTKEDTKTETKKSDDRTPNDNSTNNNTSSNNSSDNSNTNTNTTGGSKGRLYFCEDYRGEEINVSSTFTPGWLTVMTKLNQPIGVSKVELRLEEVVDGKAKDIIRTIPFDVRADDDYIYFQDKQKLKFTRPGTYRVTLQKTDGTPIVSNEVNVTAN